MYLFFLFKFCICNILSFIPKLDSGDTNLGVYIYKMNVLAYFNDVVWLLRSKGLSTVVILLNLSLLS